MARTGRFGRLPTASPDLSSQIVSMMEQWQNARDQNIMDAWQNGGKFEGEKVTDKKLLKHMRERRDSYEKDDPEWDEWNNEIWQTRYRVANEGVMMKYRQGKIGEAAVARHYREWAKKMPKNSSYYRTMMQDAGQWQKAAQSGRASGGSGGGSGGGGGDPYAAALRNMDAIQKRDIDPLDSYFNMLNDFARSHGLIEQEQTVFDLGLSEHDDMKTILAGANEILENNPDLMRYMERNYPDLYDGPINAKTLDKMAVRAKQGKLEQAKVIAKVGNTSWAQALRAEAGQYMVFRGLDDRLDAFSFYEEAFTDWDAMAQTGGNPMEVLAGDPAYRKELEIAYQKFLDADMTAEAGRVHAEMRMLDGEVEGLSGSDVQPLWMDMTGVPQGTAEDVARNHASMVAGEGMLLDNTAYLVRTGEPLSPEDKALGAVQGQGFVIRSYPPGQNGRTGLSDPSMFIIPRKAQGGANFDEVYQGTEIRSEEGQHMGYFIQYDGGEMMTALLDRDGQTYKYTKVDWISDSGLNPRNLTNGYLEVDSAITRDRRMQAVDRNTATIVREFFGERPDTNATGLSAEEEKERLAAASEWDANARAVEELDAMGMRAEDMPNTLMGSYTLADGEDPVDATRMIEEIKMNFPIGGLGGYILDENVQTARVREAFRETWDEDINGPMPSSFEWDPATDGKYITQTGEWVENFETPQMAETRILKNGGVDEYQGQLAHEATPAVYPDAVADTAPVTATQPQPEGAAPPAAPNIKDAMRSLPSDSRPDEWPFDFSQNEALGRWDLLLSNEAETYATAQSAHIFGTPRIADQYNASDAGYLMTTMQKSPGMTADALGGAAQEVDYNFTLAGHDEMTRKYAKLEASSSTPELLEAAMNLGVLEKELEGNTPAFDALQQAERAYAMETGAAPPLDITKPIMAPEPTNIQGPRIPGQTMFGEAVGDEPLGPQGPNVPKAPGAYPMGKTPNIKPVNMPTIDANVPGYTPPSAPRFKAPSPGSFPKMPRGFKAPNVSVPNVPPPPSINSALGQLSYTPKPPPAAPNINDALKQIT